LRSLNALPKKVLLHMGDWPRERDSRTSGSWCPPRREYVRKHKAYVEDALTQAVAVAFRAESPRPLAMIAQQLLLYEWQTLAHLEQPTRRPSIDARVGAVHRPLLRQYSKTHAAHRTGRQRTTRMQFRKSMYQVVGTSAAGHELWRDDFVNAQAEGCLLLGMSMEGRGDSHGLRAFNVGKGYHAKRVAAGFTDREAEIIGCMMSNPIEAAVAQALREDSNRYAAITRDAIIALSSLAKRQSRPAPPVYALLHAPDGRGLAVKDPKWDFIESPDETGFRGLTTYAPIPLRPASEARYSEEGLVQRVKGHAGGGQGTCGPDGEMRVSSGTVICVLSEAAGEGSSTCHSAVQVAEGDYLLPPLTLLAVQDVVEEFIYLEDRPPVRQKCIYVRPTFMSTLGTSEGGEGGSKFLAQSASLSYGATAAFVTSLTPLIQDPVLSLKQEWVRNETWTDRKGGTCSALTEWLYVCGTVGDAETRHGTGFGARDDGHEG